MASTGRFGKFGEGRLDHFICKKYVLFTYNNLAYKTIPNLLNDMIITKIYAFAKPIEYCENGHMLLPTHPILRFNPKCYFKIPTFYVVDRVEAGLV